MSEFMGLVRGAYEAKQGGFVPGGASLHNAMSGHGPDRASYDQAIAAQLAPQKLDDTLAFMFETRYAFATPPASLDAPTRDRAYDAAWDGFAKARVPR
jgi:homogentisate 1,2-dioxygenase